MTKEKDLDESQARVREEEGTGDPHLSQKPRMTWQMRSS